MDGNLMAQEQTGRDIFISNIGIVSIKTNDGTHEVTFDDFVKDVDKGIIAGKYLIRYDTKSNQFYLLEGIGDTKYIHTIDIDKKVMEDYVFGKYDKVTLALIKLLLKSDEKIYEEVNKQERDKMRNDAINKIDSSHEVPTPLEARLYLDHIKKENKTSALAVGRSTSKVAALAGIPLTGGAVVGAVVATSVSTITLPIVLGSAAIGVLSSLLVYLIEDMGLMLSDDSDSYGSFLTNVFDRVIESIEDIQEQVKKIRLNKAKADGLKKINYVDKIAIPEECTMVENDEVNSLNLEDQVMNMIDNYVDVASLLNPKDRSDILSELKDILNEYVARGIDIANKDINSGDSIFNLRVDITKRLAQVEIKINDVRKRDVETRKLVDEGMALADKIEEYEIVDDNQLKK